MRRLSESEHSSYMVCREADKGRLLLKTCQSLESLSEVVRGFGTVVFLGKGHQLTKNFWEALSQSPSECYLLFFYQMIEELQS